MKQILKRIYAMIAVLFLVLCSVPVFSTVHAEGDPLEREEDVPAWKLTDMYTEVNPDGDLYGSPARFDVSQFEHVMVYEDAVHTARMDDLPAVVEDNTNVKISMADHISTGDSGSTGLMNTVEVIGYDAKGKELPKRHYEMFKISSYGEKENTVRFARNEDGIKKFEIVWTSLAGKSVWVYELTAVKKVITGGYWQLTGTENEVPEDILQSEHETIDPKDPGTLADERFRANGSTHVFEHNIIGKDEKTMQDGIHCYYYVTTQFTPPPATLRTGDEIRIHITMEIEKANRLFKRLYGTFDFDNEDTTHVHTNVTADKLGSFLYETDENIHHQYGATEVFRTSPKKDIPEIDVFWTVPEYRKTTDNRYDTVRIICSSANWIAYIGGFLRITRTIYTYEYVPQESVLEGAGMVGGSAAEPVEPIEQEIVTPASEKPGEDQGTDMISEIIDGTKDPRTGRNIGIAIGGALVAGGIGALAAGNSDSGDDEKKKKRGYRMYVNKDFGNMLKRGEPAKNVFARIAELTPGGGEATRNDLTAKIEAFSGDGVLEVTDAGMSGDYKAAVVKVPDDCTAAQGCVSFRYTGEGGSFTRHVVFNLTAAQILFPQENLGLPANKLKYVVEDKGTRIGNGEYRMPFYVKDMPAKYSVKAVIERVGSTDVRGNFIHSSEIKEPLPYTVEVIPDPDDGDKGFYIAVIRETGEYELGAGVSEGFTLTVTAESGKPGDKDYEKAEGVLPVYRIHLGLAVTVESSSIPCYFRLKPGRENKNRDEISGDDLEIQYTEGSMLLFLCDEKDLSIIRVPVSPQAGDDGKPLPLKITPTKVENDRYCKRGDANESHQALVDKLGIYAFATGRLLDNGAQVVKFCATRGSMEAPTRLLADMEISTVYRGKTYKCVKKVLLRSQEFRVAKNSEDERAFLEKDKHVTERLLRISQLIDSQYSYNLFSLGDMIDRMLDGYDYRFGFDENQVNAVMEMWVGFIEGTFAGARGTPVGITFADELKACYAFMQGLRDNTGFLGRVAMGVMTAGVSEYVFTTMTVAEKMHDAVFACKGKEFGFWDGIEIGVTEFGKQILMELAFGAAVKKAANTNLGFKIGEKLADIGTKYRTQMDAADLWMKTNSKLYKMGDDALQGAKNFFNSSSKAGKSAIDEYAKDADEAAARAEELLKKNRKNLTAEELIELQKHERDMETGMKKLRDLQEAQTKLKEAKDPASLKKAEADYRRAADEVWTDKNALRQLQRNQHSTANEIRAQFNHYRENLLDEVQLEALDDIARETGIPRENLDVMNVSNNTKVNIKTGKKVPGDRDISFKQKVLSDRTKDLTIDQNIGERIVARRLFKKMNGREADSIEEALEFMKSKDVTYVNPQKSSSSAFVFEHNLEGYEDLAGMTGVRPDGTVNKDLMANDLHNLTINRASVKYKAMEWFQRGDVAEGVHQITKQVDNIIIPRGIRRTGKNPLPPEAMRIHEMALKVADGSVEPVVFKAALRNEYGMTLEGYADYMSRFLD